MRPTIYDRDYVEQLLEDDEISAEEAGFMYWYDADESEILV